MDNCAVHKNIDVITMIEETGAIVYFLPPYSPVLNPVSGTGRRLWRATSLHHPVNSTPIVPAYQAELVFSKMKAVLRKHCDLGELVSN
jgi:hypothetical protein